MMWHIWTYMKPTQWRDCLSLLRDGASGDPRMHAVVAITPEDDLNFYLLMYQVFSCALP